MVIAGTLISLVGYLHVLRSIDSGGLAQVAIMLYNRLCLLMESFEATLELFRGIVGATSQWLPSNLF